jgi:hypothetical protein
MGKEKLANSNALKRWQTRRYLGVIAHAISLFLKQDIPVEGSVSNFDYHKDKQTFRQLLIFPLTDGHAVTYNTRGSFVLYAHQFIFPDVGEPIYRKNTYDKHEEVVPSQLAIEGLQQISNHQVSAEQVRVLYPLVLSAVGHNWAGVRTIEPPHGLSLICDK